jgi:valyl-tRNA synthetase
VEFRADHVELEDRWLMNRMAVIAGEVNSNLEKRRLNDAAYVAYNFFRHELCDWYLESIKPRLRDEDRRAEATCLAVAALGFSYRLLHPVMPFITEELWHALPGVDSYLITSSFPTAETAPFAADAERFEEMTGIVSVIRSLRSDMNVPPGRRGQAILRCDKDDQAERLGASAERIALLAKLETVTVRVGGETPSPAGTGLAGTVEVFLPMAGLVDEAKEKERLGKELSQLEGWIMGSRKKLENENFTARAPENVVARERDQLVENEAKAEALRARIAEFGE